MTRLKRKISFLMILIGLVLIISACGKDATETTSETSEAEESEAKETNTPEITEEFHFAYDTQPPAIDPLATTVVATRDVARHIFETLLVFNYDYEVKSMLAESWEESDDGTEYTFYLREGVMFHNGEEMLADDVVASMNRWRENSVYARMFFEDAVFEKVDDYTVTLTLEEPSVFVIPAMASMDQAPIITPKDVAENATETGIEEFIGTGPFQFVEWKQDQYILLERYEDYQPVDDVADGLSGKKEALIEKLYFDFVPDSTTRLNGLQGGEYDISYSLDLDNLETIQNDPNLEVYHTYTEPVGLIFNKFEGLMTDQKLRQAINAALDLDAISRAAYVNEENYRLNSSYMQVEQQEWYSDAGSELYNQKDPEKAKELLAESNYNGEKIRFLASREYSDAYNASVVIQEQLTEIGLNVELEVYDWATVVNRRSDPSNWELLVTGLPVTTSPIENLVFTDSWIDGPEDKKTEDLLDRIKHSADMEEAKELWDELQAYSWEFLPYIKLADRADIMAANINVKGLTDPFGPGPILWNTYVEE